MVYALDMTWWEMCKKFKISHMNKWYVHNPIFDLVKDTQKLQWIFDIQTDHMISTRRLDLILIKKRTNKIGDFAVPANQRIKLKESEMKDKFLDLARELKKLWNKKVKNIPFMIRSFGTVIKRL